MTNSKYVPKRRFKEFELDDEWEQLKLGEHANILTGGTPNTSISSYWEPKEIPWMSSGEVNRRRLDKTDNMISNDGIRNSSARWVKKHSILIALAGQGKTRGMVAVNNIPLTTNQSIAAIEPDKTLNYEFVFQNLSKRYDELRLISSGDGSRGGLNKQIVSDISIACPNVNEQELIGNFLADFDSLITMNQHKLDKLKDLKKAYLTEMFPAEGERVPKRRFPGFEGEWEKTRLSKVAEIEGGGTPSTAVPEYWDGTVDWYTPAEIGDEVFVNQSIRKITDLGLQKSSAKMLPVGTVLFTSRAGIGKTAILAREGCTNQGFQSIIPKEGLLDSYFIYSLSNKLKSYGERIGAGSTFVEVSGKQMSEMSLIIPSIFEQKQIGNFFNKLDQSISLQQQKLDKLNDLKKAYLNELFV